jgi:Na+/H+ antiporter NhaD/arsenite permease-like protein
MPHLLPAIAACVIFVGAYVLIATEKWVTRTAAALGGAALVLALGISDAEAAFYSEETGVDWNVVFLLLGMMIIVSVMRETGIFEFLAIWAAKRAGGRPFPLMVLLILITAVASALLDNVTTVLLIAPVTILLCQRLDLPVTPYLLAEVFASNIGGTATLVGDPPNIIIASRGGLSFNDFLVHLAPVVVVLVAVLIGLCRWLFADAFRIDEGRVAEILALNEREAIEDRRLLVQSLAVLGVVLAAFVLSPVLGYEPSVVALLGAGLLIAITRVTPARLPAAAGSRAAARTSARCPAGPAPQQCGCGRRRVGSRTTAAHHDPRARRCPHRAAAPGRCPPTSRPAGPGPGPPPVPSSATHTPACPTVPPGTTAWSANPRRPPAPPRR